MRRLSILLVLAFCTAQPLRASFLYETGGQVVGEAELFSYRTSNAGEIAWSIRPTETGGTTPQAGGPIIANARGGEYIQSLPDEDSTGGGGHLDEPGAFYQMLITTPGTYRLYVRWDGNNTSSGTRGASDSLFADIVELKDGPGGSIADWYEMTQDVNANFASPAWDAGGGAEQDQAGASNNPMVWDIPSVGHYTLRFTVREDGSAIDAWVFQLSNLPAPTGTGPAASRLSPEPTSLALLGLFLALVRRRRR